jgi:hypothetical protein
MTQHLLNHSNITTMVEKMRRETVSKNVGCDFFKERGLFYPSPDQEHHPILRDPCSPKIGEQRFTVVGASAGAKVGTKAFQSVFSDGNDPLLGALTEHPHGPGEEVDVADVQGRDLGPAQARGVEQLDEGTIPLLGRTGGGGRREDLIHLGFSQEFGE